MLDIAERLARVERVLAQLGVDLESDGSQSLRVSELVVQGPGGEDRIRLKTVGEAVAGVFIRDSNGSQRICLASQGENGAGLQVFSNSQTMLLQIGHRGSESSVTLYTKEGRPQTAMMASGSRAGVAIFDGDGKKRVACGIHPGGEGIQVTDQEGHCRQF